MQVQIHTQVLEQRELHMWELQVLKLHMQNRETSLDPKTKATQNFMKYIRDIVLEISFLDINTGPHLSRSNLKLWKEMLITQEGVIRYQMFLHVVDGHEKTDFLC